MLPLIKHGWLESAWGSNSTRYLAVHGAGISWMGRWCFLCTWISWIRGLGRDKDSNKDWTERFTVRKKMADNCKEFVVIKRTLSNNYICIWVIEIFRVWFRIHSCAHNYDATFLCTVKTCCANYLTLFYPGHWHDCYFHCETCEAGKIKL